MTFILNMARREMRGSWRRLLVFFGCIAIGVAAMVSVRSFTERLGDATVNEARALVSADVRVDTANPAQPNFRPLLQRFPEGVLLADINGRTVGFCVAVIDANQALARVRGGRLFPFGIWKLYRGLKRVAQARVMALGLRPEYRHSGIDALMYFDLLSRGQRLGYRRAELSWTLEDNHAMNRAIRLGGRHHKTYRLYDLPLPRAGAAP